VAAGRFSSTEHASAIHRRTDPLLTTLQRLNGGQGLGFVVLGVVLDRKTLNKAAVGVASVFATLVPVVLALQPDVMLRGLSTCLGIWRGHNHDLSWTLCTGLDFSRRTLRNRVPPAC
jgi:hypothetical protein